MLYSPLKYSPNRLRQKQSSPKIIPLCPALTNAFPGLETFKDQTHFRRVVEANVGAVLATLPGSLYYWREGDFELDFVRVHKGKVFAVEVKSGDKRRANSVGKFLKKYPDAVPVVITEEDLPGLHMKKLKFFDV